MPTQKSSPFLKEKRRMYSYFMLNFFNNSFLLYFTFNIFKIGCRFNTNIIELLPLRTVFNDSLSTGKDLHGSGNRTHLSSGWTVTSRSRSHLRQTLYSVDRGTKIFVWERRGQPADPLRLEQGEVAAHQLVNSSLKENSKRICRLKVIYRYLTLKYLSDVNIEIHFCQMKVNKMRLLRIYINIIRSTYVRLGFSYVGSRPYVVCGQIH